MMEIMMDAHIRHLNDFFCNIFIKFYNINKYFDFNF